MKLFTARFTVRGFILRLLRPVMIAAGAAILLLSGCAAPAQTPTPPPRPSQTPTQSQPPTHTPTRLPTRTATPSPTATFTRRPTSTPRPTSTRRPTATPPPTHTPTLTPKPQENAATANVNLRAGPGTNYPVVGGLEKGDAVEIAGQTGDGQWYRIKQAGGSFAWVAANYVQVNTGSAAIPVVAASEIPPTPSPAPTVPPTAPPAPAYRPPTGMLEDYAGGGQGKLLIKNGTDADALVILTGLDDKAVKSAYIRAEESFNMSGIQDGTYRLYYSKGQAFNQETRRFAQNATYQRLDATIGFTTSATQYTAWEVTLYGVTGGNVGSERVDPSQFP